MRNNTSEAIEAGICGGPSYRVFEKTSEGWVISGPEGGVVWGQDELVVVEDLVAGWKQEASSVGGYDSSAPRKPETLLSGKL